MTRRREDYEPRGRSVSRKISQNDEPLLPQESAYHRQEKVYEELYKVFAAVHTHILQTGCEHCKSVLREGIDD